MNDYKTEMLTVGMSDEINILSEEAMDGILGGDTKCKKGYSLDDAGIVECGCKYRQTPKQTQSVQVEITTGGN